MGWRGNVSTAVCVLVVFLSVNSITQKDVGEFTLNLGMVHYGAEKGLINF